MANAEILNSPVRILVVDDHEEWRQHICSTLETRPELRVICEASDGLEAVQRAQELKPDLILLDIGLPNLNGIEAATRISQIVPASRILFLSQNNDADVVRAALSNGAWGYVLKADADKELLPALGAILQGEKFVSRRLRSLTSPTPEDHP